MKNIEVSIKGNVATITIDLSKRLGKSASGKTVIIASTQGNVEIAEGVSLGINCYTK